MHDDPFAGEQVPFGALVFFKPSPTRENPFSDKFDPKAVPGIFAGYELNAGMRWSRKYAVWALMDFVTASLAYDCEGIPLKLKQPQIVEVVKMKHPI